MWCQLVQPVLWPPACMNAYDLNLRMHDAACMITAHSRAMPPAAAALRRFGFSKWAVSLNSTPPGMERLLPPSDVRWRRDVHLLEQGQYEQVNSLEGTPVSVNA